MSNQFTGISDEDLKAEFEERGLSSDAEESLNEIISNHDDSNDEAYADAQRQVNDNDDDWSRRLQVLCDSYQYDSESIHADKMKEFLVDHGGLIA